MSPFSCVSSTCVYTLYVSNTGSCSCTRCLFAVTVMKRSLPEMCEPACLTCAVCCCPCADEEDEEACPLTTIFIADDVTFFPLTTACAGGTT